MKQDKHLDEQIRKVLENLEASAEPLAWDSFEKKLDAAEHVIFHFDAEMKRRLGGLEAPVHVGDWNFLESRLDSEDAAEVIENEATLDNLAYEKLSNFSARYQAAHWRLMAERIEKEFSLRHTLYKYKVMEAALLLLLLLTTVRFAPLAEDFFRRVGTAKQNQHIELAPAPQAGAQASMAPSDECSGDLTASNCYNRAKSPANSKQLAGNFQSGNFFNKLGQKNPSQTLSSDKGLVNKNFPAKTASTGLPFLQFEEVNLLKNPAPQLGKNNSADNRVPGEVAAPGHIEGLKNKPVLSEFGWEIPAAIANPFRKGSKQLRFTILTTSDLNIVTTPPDKVSISDTLVATDPSRSTASGYGGGILVSLKSNRLEFQTGGVYSFKRYMPGTSDFWWESVKYYVKEGFDGIQLDIFQMPLNLQYHFKNTGNWRMYVSGGVSGQVVTSSVHEFGRQKPLPLLIPQFGQELDRTIRQEEELAPGVLNGGTFQDNFYLTGNLGFGIERFVSPRWALFFQPNYQHNLMSEGIGVNRDKIYSLSFYLGTKVGLK